MGVEHIEKYLRKRGLKWFDQKERDTKNVTITVAELVVEGERR